MSRSSSRSQDKTEFWGYDQHDRSVLDVVDEDTWETELEWALRESLGYARVIADVNSVTGARHWASSSFTDRFEAMLNDLLHEPLNICTATETVQETRQGSLTDYNSPQDGDEGE